MPSDPEVRVLLAEPDDLHAAALERAMHGDRFEVRRYVGPPDGLPDAAPGHRVLVIGPTMSWVGLPKLVPVLLQAGCRLLVMSDGRFDDDASELLYAGATGFLSHADSNGTDVADAVIAISRGSTALNPDVVRDVLARWRQQRSSPPSGVVPALTARERDVLAGIRDGLTTRLLAKRLGVAEKTIESHKSKLFTKLGVRTQRQAIEAASERGLL